MSPTCWWYFFQLPFFIIIIIFFFSISQSVSILGFFSRLKYVCNINTVRHLHKVCCGGNLICTASWQTFPRSHPDWDLHHWSLKCMSLLPLPRFPPGPQRAFCCPQHIPRPVPLQGSLFSGTMPPLVSSIPREPLSHTRQAGRNGQCNSISLHYYKGLLPCEIAWNP